MGWIMRHKSSIIEIQLLNKFRERRRTMKTLHIEDIDNLNFWTSYFGCSYPNSYDEEEDTSISELMYELYTEEIESWWNKFTGYYDGVMDESDGYLDDPTTLEALLTPDKVLKIEFHPGDILYFVNEKQIGSTGPHWMLQTVPYEEVKQLLTLENERQLFLLLLPLAVIKQEEITAARKEIEAQMRNYFPENLCERVSGCIVTGLTESV